MSCRKDVEMLMYSKKIIFDADEIIYIYFYTLFSLFKLRALSIYHHIKSYHISN